MKNTIDELNVDQKQRLYQMKKSSSFIMLSIIIRIVALTITTIYQFEPISFVFFGGMIILGLIAVVKKQTLLLFIYGLISIIQATCSYIFIIYVAIKLHQQSIIVFLFFSTVIVLISLGALFSWKLRKQIQEYEINYGPVPRCCDKKCATNQITTETTTETTNNEIQMNHIQLTDIQRQPEQSPPPNRQLIFVAQPFFPQSYNQHVQIQPQITNMQAFDDPNQLFSPNQQQQMQQQQMLQQQMQQQQMQQQMQQQQMLRRQFFTPEVISQEKFVPQQNVVYRF